MKKVKLIIKKLNLAVTKVKQLNKIYIIFFTKEYILIIQDIQKLDIKNNINSFIPNFNNFFQKNILDGFFLFFKIPKIFKYNKLGF